ncbi:MAG: cysteine desulfurase family protein [Bdellovibrionales bacterium]|nr:cysteine desulfurase family protein [Bdellovibrionales bacterium]
MDHLTQGSKKQIYLDHNATTPPDAEVLARISIWARDWGNPSSIHQAGRGPKARLRDARSSVASMIGVSTLEIIFTSCGSESNSTAILGSLQALRRRGDLRRHILSSPIEHPSIRRTLESLKSDGYEIEYVPVDRSGLVSATAFSSRIRPGETVLITCMLVNNETGVIQPVKEIVQAAKLNGVLVHTDAVQALGKTPVNLAELGVDYASFAGHKFYALRGAGVLFARKGAPLDPLIQGGGQERNRRGGTENTLAIASLGYMCTRASEVSERSLKMAKLRDYFEARVLSEIPEVSVTGKESPRVGSTSSLLIPGIDGETLLMSLDMEGIAVSTGAACSSGSPEPSPVLLAMGLSREEAQCSLRVGVGWSTTSEEIDQFIDVLKKVVQRLRSLRGWEMSEIEVLNA